jgi:16S rRNA (cytosine1402-N4)-methyltransferase
MNANSVNHLNQFGHESVMLNEVLETFQSLPIAMKNGMFLDATLGGAGHSTALLSAHPELHLLGLDQDETAISNALKVFGANGMSERVTLRRTRFDAVGSVLVEEGIGSLAGALFDLGVSSPQFDIAERGFSYRHDGPLDMRMDRSQTLTADTIVNHYEASEISRVLREYADERFSDRIARAIVAARPIIGTAHLAQVVVSAIPAATRRTGGHPAKRTFQALRIEVNNELAILEPTLNTVIDSLAVGARIAVITFHSGEDRIVKNIFRMAETGGCECPPTLPCGCGAVRKVVKVRVARDASAEETNRNPRAASARLRVVERIASGKEN